MNMHTEGFACVVWKVWLRSSFGCVATKKHPCVSWHLMISVFSCDSSITPRMSTM